MRGEKAFKELKCSDYLRSMIRNWSFTTLSAPSDSLEGSRSALEALTHAEDRLLGLAENSGIDPTVLLLRIMSGDLKFPPPL
jgi:hypothetical protein